MADVLTKEQRHKNMNQKQGYQDRGAVKEGIVAQGVSLPQKCEVTARNTGYCAD